MIILLNQLLITLLWTNFLLYFTFSLLARTKSKYRQLYIWSKSESYKMKFFLLSEYVHADLKSCKYGFKWKAVINFMKMKYFVMLWLSWFAIARSNLFSCVFIFPKDNLAWWWFDNYYNWLLLQNNLYVYFPLLHFSSNV